jgi:Tfp pilus assembly major pilin PilA
MRQFRQAAGFWLVTFTVVAVVAVLAAIAIPHVGQMMAKDEAEARELELHKVQTAVSDMLYQSICQLLEPIGPTTDMNEVRTRDIDPLVLADYLDDVELETGCRYSFAADGTVVQVAP